jgi:hypothetical protein
MDIRLIITTIEDGVSLTFTATLNIETFFLLRGYPTYYLAYGVDIKVLLYNTTTNTLVDSQLLTMIIDVNC